ncbi:MAG: DNA helicase HerA-like ATPase, partial [Planctomycetota bacterium]
MQDFEHTSKFYLGRAVDTSDGSIQPEPLMYDSKDLCTHALIVGMTGSGKTGLGVGLLEEAALDGIPSIVIDPKGDMSNLMLQFPNLTPEEFAPWVDKGAAARKGQSVEEFAASTAEMWRGGLEKWGQTPERVQRLKDSAEFSVYTPGLRSGRPLRVLKSFDAPAAELRADSEAMDERVESSVSGLLALLGIDADPLQSREAILLSNILLTAWREGENLDLAELIHQVQEPPFERLGVLSLESFFPKKERF